MRFAEGVMKMLGSVLGGIGLVSGFSMLLATHGVDLTTSLPFYGNSAKVSAVSYQINQTDMDTGMLLVKSGDDMYSAPVDVTPTYAEDVRPQSDVAIHRYGDSALLDRVWAQGEKYGMRVDPAKAELKAVASIAVIERSMEVLK
jgi:hypothetical protein